MNLSAPFVARPVATTLLAVAVALAGVLGFALLPVAPLPEVDFPTISVSATLPGAEPTIVASSVATPLERQFGHIAGVTEMTSVSSLGATRITLQFDLNRDIDGAARDVQAAINAARTNLPANLDGNPTYRKVNPADAPILIIGLTSASATRGQMYDAADTVLEQKLLQTPGVGDVTVGGGALPAVRIELNPDRVNHYGISLENVRSAVAAANTLQPKGWVNVHGRHYAIAANDTLEAAAQYEPIIVRQTNGNVVRIQDLGTVQEGIENLENYGLSNAQPAVLLIVFKQPGANVIKTVDTVKAALPFLQASIPANVHLSILMDRTSTIRASLSDVELTLVISILLVTAVTFVFFRNWRSTLVPAIAVPLSLLGTFAVMYALGFSLNNLSLMALTISTGFVVDDAIVVVENITRHLERGEAPRDAALNGAQEVGFTVLSISISLIAVFIPLLFMGGIVGRLFREFSVTLSVAIIISMLISLTFTPMLSLVLLRVPGRAATPPGGAAGNDGAERPQSRWHRFYERSLGWVIGHPVLMLVVTLLVLLLSVILYGVIPKGFFPQEDTGRLSGMVKASQTISYHAMQAKFQAINQAVLKNPNVATVAGFVGGSNAIDQGNLFVTLKPLGPRKAGADVVIAQLRRALADVPGARLYLQSAQDITVGGRQSGAQYQYTLTADDQTMLDQWVPKVVAKLKTIPLLTDLNTDQETSSAQVTVQVNRATAARLGVNFNSIDQGLYDSFGQRQVSTIYKAMNQYHVVMELAPNYWTDPAALDAIFIPAGPASATAAGSTGGSTAAGSLGIATQSSTSGSPSGTTAASTVSATVTTLAAGQPNGSSGSSAVSAPLVAAATSGSAGALARRSVSNPLLLAPAGAQVTSGSGTAGTAASSTAGSAGSTTGGAALTGSGIVAPATAPATTSIASSASSSSTTTAPSTASAAALALQDGSATGAAATSQASLAPTTTTTSSGAATPAANSSSSGASTAGGGLNAIPAGATSNVGSLTTPAPPGFGTGVAAAPGGSAVPALAAATPAAAATSSGYALVPLSALAKYRIEPTAISVNHQGTFPAVTASFNLAPGASIGDATAQINRAIAELRLPSSIQTQFAGTAQAFQASVQSEPILVLAALLAVYVVLGILYEDLMHPLTILSSLPSAGVGALIALLLTGTDLSIIALVGVILLIGIVKKNAIMMVDFAISEERARSLSPQEAILNASLIRFRPIMMTTLAAILGATPLVIGGGYGSEFRRPLGIAIIGGLIFSQLLTLYSTPVIYLWMDRIDRWLKRRNKRRQP